MVRRFVEGSSVRTTTEGDYLTVVADCQTVADRGSGFWPWRLSSGVFPAPAGGISLQKTPRNP